MLAAIQIFLLGLAGFFLLCLVLGLIKPVLVLWFLDRFNRRKVISYYGKSLFFSLLAWRIMALIGPFAE